MEETRVGTTKVPGPRVQTPGITVHFGTGMVTDHRLWGRVVSDYFGDSWSQRIRDFLL